MKKLMFTSITALALLGSFLTFDKTIPEKDKSFCGAIECEVKYPNSRAELGRPAYVPTDQYYSSNQNISMNHIGNIERTWDFYKGENLTVAIIDTGIDYLHPDLYDENGNSRIRMSDARWYVHKISQDGPGTYTTCTGQYASGTPIYFPVDGGTRTVDGITYVGDEIIKHSLTGKYTSHGTNVAGTVAAFNHDTSHTGTIGIAPRAKILPIKIDFYMDSVGYALQYVYELNTDDNPNNDVQVVNMSIESGSTHDLIEEYTEKLTEIGTILIAAAGNSTSTTPSYPAADPYVVGVGALARDSSSTIASYSNYNATNATSSTVGNNTEVVAPGHVYVPSYTGSHTYVETHGTSFASPIVAGAALLWKEQNPNGSVDDFLRDLHSSCTDIGTSGWDNVFGYGALSISKLLYIDSPTEIVVNNSEIVDETLELTAGDTFDLDWTVNGIGTFSDAVTIYPYQDEEVISVDENGHIEALKEGESYVFIESEEDSNVYYGLTVLVSPSQEQIDDITSVDVSPSTLYLSLDGSTTGNLSAVVNGNNNPSQSVTWTSSDTSVATVNNSGVVTAVANGNAVITATSTVNTNKKGTCSVTVRTVDGSTQYSLITSVDDLEVGKSYLIAGGTSGTVKTMSRTANTDNRPTVSLTVSNDKLTRGSSALSVTLGGSQGAYTFKTDNYGGTAGYLNATNTTGSNVLQVVSTLNNYAYFSISFSNSQAVITCTGKSSRNIIRLNNNDTPISCYTSGQKPVYLWKEVINKTLSGISVFNPPSLTTYEVGDNFDPTGLVITRTYTDTTSDTYTYAGHTSEFTFSPTTSTALAIGNTSVTITYGGKSCSQSITVKEAKTLSSISISGYKSSFVEGDAFSFGGTVTAHYSDSTTSNVTASASFSGYNMTAVGNHTVTVSYTYKGTTKTQTYQITVSEGTLSSIVVSGMTTEYLKNYAFSFDGTCTATFANGYEKAVTPTSVSSPDMSTAGNKTITVSYTYNGNTETTTYDIIVNSNRTVIEEVTTTDYSVIGTVTWSSATATISPSNCGLTVTK